MLQQSQGLTLQKKVIPVLEAIHRGNNSHYQKYPSFQYEREHSGRHYQCAPSCWIPALA